MSARIRLTAKTAVNAMAITATRTVIGTTEGSTNQPHRSANSCGRCRPARGTAPACPAPPTAPAVRARRRCARVDPALQPARAGSARPPLRQCWRARPDSGRVPAIRSAARPRAGRGVLAAIGARGLHHRGGRLLLTGDGQQRLIEQRGLRAGGRRGGRLARAKTREVEGVREDHLHAGRPVRAFETEA